MQLTPVPNLLEDLASSDSGRRQLLRNGLTYDCG